MKGGTVVKVFVIAFLLFLLTVALGLIFNWGTYLKEKTTVQGQSLTESESQQILADTNTEEALAKKKRRAVSVEIVSDSTVNTTTEQIKNDCIRASRRAGVGDSEIHAVVQECVELSLQTRKNQPVSGRVSDANSNMEFTTDSNMSLTRGACEMVVSEQQQSLNNEEKERLIIQCVKENSQ